MWNNIRNVFVLLKSLPSCCWYEKLSVEAAVLNSSDVFTNDKLYISEGLYCAFKLSKKMHLTLHVVRLIVFGIEIMWIS